MEKVVKDLVDKSVKSDREYFSVANSNDLMNFEKYIKARLSDNMKNISYDYLFESDIAKIVKKKETSNAVKIETLKRMVKLIIKQELSEKQRTILDMYFVRRLKCNQIAEILSISMSTVSRTEARALKTIYKILKYYDFT